MYVCSVKVKTSPFCGLRGEVVIQFGHICKSLGLSLSSTGCYSATANLERITR
jgi:hypothetical protein